MAQFKNQQELVWYVTDRLLERISGLQSSGSRISPSQYLSIMGPDPDSDDEDDRIAIFCIRVSDHDARSCTSTIHHSINVMRDLSPEEIMDDGEFDGLEVDTWRIEDAIELAARKASHA